VSMVICRYPDGSHRIVDSGVSLPHAQELAKHYAELDGGESGCVWIASEESRSPVKIPRHVLGGVEAVRSSRECNMFDVPCVQVVARRMGYYETELWIGEHQELYVKGIFNGFEPES
jgi:Domain of unknown function (DUF5049)